MAPASRPDREADDRRPLLVIDEAASASSLESFSAAVLEGIARHLGIRRAALWLGSAPAVGIELSAGQDLGFDGRVMRRYLDDFVEHDPFRQPVALEAFGHDPVVALPDIRSRVPLGSTEYIRRFLGEEGVNDQRSLWLDTGGDVHGYLAVLDSTGAVLPDDVDDLLRRLRPALTSLLRLHLANERSRMIPVDEHSPAERRVLDLVLTGRSNREIAELLSLSEHTVKKHLTSVFRRTGTTSRAELIAATDR